MIKDALKIEQLNVQIQNQHILKDFNLSLNQGDILCLLGPSGCGKTTALKAIAGLIKTDIGFIELFSNTIKDNQIEVAPESREMGFIFQDYALFPHLTVFENVAYALKGQRKSDIEKQVHNNLALVQLDQYTHRYPHELSGGQQQRTAVARALSNKPKLLLMDEPFSNIDNQVKQNMIKSLRALLKENNITCIFVTHSKQEAFSFADKTAILNNGHIEQVDSTEKIFEKPCNEFVATFMEAGNILSQQEIPAGLTTVPQTQKEIKYLLKENGFKVHLERGKGANAKVIDCLYAGHKYLLEVQVEETKGVLTLEHSEPLTIGREISLTYAHDPVAIPV